MGILSERVAKSIKDKPRDLYDIIRNLALLIPDEHELADSAHACLDSMEFAPPENYPLYVERFTDELSNQFPESTKEVPWWAMVCSVLVMGGGFQEASDFLISELDGLRPS